MKMTKKDLINIIIEEIKEVNVDELQTTGGAAPKYDAAATIGALAVQALQLVLSHLVPSVLAGTGAYQGDDKITKQLVGKMKDSSFVDGKFGPLTRKSLRLALKTPIPEGVSVDIKSDGPDWIVSKIARTPVPAVAKPETPIS